MKRLILFITACLPLIFISCSKDLIDPQGPVLPSADFLDVSVSAGGVSIGVSITDTTEISVSFAGEVAKDSLGATAGSYGLIYAVAETDSLTSAKAVRLPVTARNPDGKFALEVKRLTPGMRYIWSVYVENEGELVLGDVKVFSAVKLVAPKVLDVSDVTYESVTFEGTVTVPKAASKDLVYGILYSDDEKALHAYEGDEFEIDVEDIDKKGGFSVELGGLDSSTDYFYLPYISMNKVTVYGQEGEFSTDSNPVTDLSKGTKATANSYIVTKGGKYKFPAMMGNGKNYVQGGKKAKVLWESFGTSVAPKEGDLISKVEFSKDYVSFTVPRSFKKGNAVIAVMNENDMILWSWHIWLTDQPKECPCADGTGTFMDRNIGATSVSYKMTESYGLLYQWGRKDPFMGSAIVYAEEDLNPSAVATVSFPTWNEYEYGKLQTTIEKPMTKMKIIDSTIRLEDLWSGSSKALYDPCPAGWRVPDYDFVDNYINKVSQSRLANFGVITYDGRSEVFFPATGACGFNADGVIGVGTMGNYWLADMVQAESPYVMTFDIEKGSSEVDFSTLPYDYQLPVRCIKEK